MQRDLLQSTAQSPKSEHEHGHNQKGALSLYLNLRPYAGMTVFLPLRFTKSNCLAYIGVEDLFLII